MAATLSHFRASVTSAFSNSATNADRMVGSKSSIVDESLYDHSLKQSFLPPQKVHRGGKKRKKKNIKNGLLFYISI